MDPSELEPERLTISEGAVEVELGRFDGHAEAVVPQLSETAEKLREADNDDEAAIFDTQIEFVQVAELADGVAEWMSNL